MKYSNENGVRFAGFAGGERDVEISLKLEKIKYNFVGCVQALSDGGAGCHPRGRAVLSFLVLFPPDTLMYLEHWCSLSLGLNMEFSEMPKEALQL